MSNSPLHFTSSLRIDEEIPDQAPNANQGSQSLSSNTNIYGQRFQAVIQKVGEYSNTLAYIKITAAMLVFLLSDTPCNQALPAWIAMMMFYDLMGIIGRMLKKHINELSRPDSSANNASNGGQEGYSLQSLINPLPVEQQNDEENGLLREQLDNEIDNPGASQRLRVYKFIIRVIEKYSPWYYAMMFFFGNSIIFDIDSDCSIKSPLMNKLAISFIILQYITISLPLLFCFTILCICCSTIFIGLFNIYKSHRQTVVNQNRIEELPTRKYPTRVAGDPECSICMCGYEDDNEIIELDCSKMHHFHADCIKKWLKVNGICPICRTKLEDMKKKTNTGGDEDYESPKLK